MPRLDIPDEYCRIAYKSSDKIKRYPKRCKKIIEFYKLAKTVPILPNKMPKGTRL
ncbi:MAG: hypothetical protein LBS81_03115 [Endomicrobium sp.]|nr:hypothetical protein [Endomicrobium sp.]